MMIYSKKSKSGLIRRYTIVGGRRLSNYWWALIIFLGGCGFLLTGVSSYLNKNLWSLPSFDFAHKVSNNNVNLFPINLIDSVNDTLYAPALQSMQSASPLGHAELPLPKKLIAQTLYAQRVNYINFFAVSAADQTNDKSFNDVQSAALVLRQGFLSASPSKHALSTAAHELTLLPIVSIAKSIERNLPFFPQGLVLCFYGILGLCFSFHLWFTIFWQIGGGFNEFNGEEKSVRIFRWGRPGKNRRIDLKYPSELIEAIKVEITPRRALFLCVKGERNIPLTRVGEPIPLEEIEAQAAELTSFLQIPLEMGN